MIHWVVSSRSAKVASFRYRAWLPMKALESIGIKSLITDDPASVPLNETTQAIILVKAFNFKTMRLAFECHVRGIPLVLDLCDNIFVKAYSEHFDGFKLCSSFKTIAPFATIIVTTSQTLAQQIRQSVGDHVVIMQCNDGMESKEEILALLRNQATWAKSKAPKAAVDTDDDDPPRLTIVAKVAKAIRHPLWAAGRLQEQFDLTLRRGCLKTIRARIDATPFNGRPVEGVGAPALAPTPLPQMHAARRICWFGVHGSTHGDVGISTLLMLGSDLIALSREIPIVLVVISNSLDRFNEYIKPLPLRTEYVEWDAVRIFDDLKRCDVCVIPNSLDEFSLGKSSNRHTLSLSLGVPVVASYTLALEAFRSCVKFDNWHENIRSYLLDAEVRRQHLAAAKTVLAESYSQASLARQWEKVIRSCRASDVRIAQNRRAILIFMDLVQDVDLCIPIIRSAKCTPGVDLRVCITRLLAATSPRALQFLEDLAIVPEIAERGQVFKGTAPKLLGVMALLTAVESNQPAHRTSFALVKRAKASGIKTYTLQHGFENIGLNYFEGKEAAGVEFASDTIFTWGNRSVITGKTPASIAKKCIAVGMVKVAGGERANIFSVPRQGYDAIVSVFENLHWNRYREKFRMSFLEQLMATIAAHPRILFLIKPHHAGRWFSKNVDRIFTTSPNCIILDPFESKWEPFTAPAIIAISQLVITTPSTVALDAARLDVPVAVFASDLDLPVYQPLTMVRSLNDWASHIQTGIAHPQVYRDAGRIFLQETVCREEAASIILAHMTSPDSSVNPSVESDFAGRHNFRALDL